MLGNDITDSKYGISSLKEHQISKIYTPFVHTIASGTFSSWRFMGCISRHSSYFIMAIDSTDHFEIFCSEALIILQMFSENCTAQK